MPFDIGSVVAHIKADISDFQAGISKAKQEASGLSNSISSVGDGIASFANKATVFTGVVAAGFALVGKSALSSASSFEQSRIAFDTMLGSAEKAQKLMKEISVFAKETPFELPQLVDASKRLLAYGLSAEQIIPTLRNLGDISAGVGMEKLPQLILAFGQVKAATKLTGMELRQFSEAGVPLLQALVDQANKAGGSWQTVGGAAKKTKVDVGEMNDKLAIAKQRLIEASASGKTKQSTLMGLNNTIQNYEQKIAGASGATSAMSKVWVKSSVTAKDMIEKISDGEVTFQMVQDALLGMTGKGGKFFEMMKTQSKTFGGTVSNIKDSIGIMLRSMMGVDMAGNIQKGSIFEVLKNAAFDFFSLLTNIQPKVTAFFTDLTNALGALVSGNYNEALTRIFGISFEQAGPLIDFIQALKGALLGLGAWIAENQELVMTFLKALAMVFGTLLIIGTVNALITALLNPFTLIIFALTAFFMAWQTNFLGIRDITMFVINAIVAFFNKYLMPAIAVLVAFIQEHWGIIQLITQVLWDIVTNIFLVAFTLVWEILSGWTKKIVEFIQAAWTKNKDFLIATWDIIVGVFKIALGVISAVLAFFMGVITGDWDKAWNQIQRAAQLAWSGIQGVLNGGINFIKAWAGSIYNSLVQPFVDAWHRIQDYVNKIKDALDFTKRHSPSVVDVVQKGVRLVNNALEGLASPIPIVRQSIGAGVTSAVGASSNGGINSIALNIDMSGAIISDEYGAERMAEFVGDKIIDKLKKNVRF